MNTQQKSWYLSRDGNQHGPFSDDDLATFAKLGQLQSTDFLWREGFPNWRAADTIFPQLEPTPSFADARNETPASVPGRQRDEEPRSHALGGLTWKVALIALACSAAVGASGGYAFRVYVTNTLLAQGWGQQ